jgi:hypothetical protein
MKVSALLVCVLAVALCVGGCGSAPSPTPRTSAPTPRASALGLEAAPWQSGSTADYQWQQDASGAQIGTSHYGFDLSSGAWTISETDNISGLEQTMQMRIDADTLAPLGETKAITTSNSTVDLTTKYEDGKLSIAAVVSGQTRTASIDVPANALDNDQLLMTLRALPFAQGFENTYTVIVAQNALKVDTTVSVLGQESVTVPAGTFDTWHVQIQAGQTKQDAWYQLDTPHNLVQYDNGTTRMILAQ